ncbi:Nramp family divalent metal transporter [Rhodoblastus sp.]|uniref:Nramp family divalent metal transporter n=1 Tax=Rhodoblastus sp. TaxID=1962975 RepID=UPI003F9B6429
MLRPLTERPIGPDGFSAARGSVLTPVGSGFFKRFMIFVGPGYLVATGYMDPGNWATALAAGSQFGMRLLFVAVLSSLMAIVLQSLSARLAFGANLDLAQACRAHFPRRATIFLWVTQEGAILATDLAEVIGTAIGLQLLFGLPLWLGAVITALDVGLILLFERFGFRKLEAFVIALLVVISACFAAQLFFARPDWAAAARGLAPTAELATNPQMLYLALGILGATVMPHNLFLHSGIVQTRYVAPDFAARREAIRFALADSAFALIFAMTINGAILILAAAAFFAHGHTEVVEISDAYRLIAPLLGAPLAAKLFAIALIACGLNSSLTATLAGQLIMDGFIRLRMSPAGRRLVTRALTITPAVATALIAGEGAVGRLLVFSQVALSFALPFAILPLVWFTGSRRIMGPFVASRATTILAGAIGVGVTLLNIKLIYDSIFG